MLIIDEKLLALDEQIDQIVAEFINLPEVTTYRLAKIEFNKDHELQDKLRLLNAQADYILYRPELKQLQKEIITNDKVYALKLAENDVQVVLSELTERIARSISDHIYIDENLPLKGGSRHDRYHRK